MEDEELISRRDRLLQEREQRHRMRQERHSAPGRFRLRAMAVIVVAAALIGWLVVSWFGSGSSSSEALPEAPELTGERTAGEELPAAPHGDGGQAPDGEAPDGESPHGEEPVDGGAGPVVVHVVGAVQSPGVVEVPAGARVHEAVEEAGGPSSEAALEGLNLAEEVQDGELIWVPTQDELDAGEAPPADQGQSDGSAGGGGQAELINLNTADAAALEELPGIGPALAERIVDHRESHGDFGSLEELAAVSGIGPAVLADVEDRVTW